VEVMSLPQTTNSITLGWTALVVSTGLAVGGCSKFQSFKQLTSTGPIALSAAEEEEGGRARRRASWWRCESRH
jgi:hypothetical protein